MFEYDGDPTGAVSPSDAPGPGTVCKLSLPQDGIDNLNESTIHQLAQAIANQLTWLQDPTARAAAGGGEPVMWWKNARGQKGFLLDHYALPGGNIVEYRETWPSATDNNAGTSGTPWTDNDLFYSTDVYLGGSGLQVAGPTATVPTRHVAMTCGTTGGLSEYCNMVGQSAVRFDDNRIVVMEGVVHMDTQVNQYTQVWGLALPGAGGYFTPSAGFVGMLIVKKDGDDWRLVTGDGTNMSTSTGFRGCVGNGQYRLRLEFVGANVADDGVAAVHGWVNGAQIDTETAVLPSAHATPYGAPILSVKRTIGASMAVRTIRVGPYKIMTNDAA